MRIPALFPNMPRRVWILFGTDLVSFVGNGLVIPFLIVYLHRVRHLSLPTAGLVLSTVAISGFVGTAVTGGLVDRIGPRRAPDLFQLAAGVGAAAIASIHSPWQAFAAAAIYGFGASGYWPSIQSMLATAVPADQRDAAFSLHFMALNAGIGLGAVIGGLAVDIAHPGSFVHVYLVDAATFLLFALLLMQMKSFDATRSEREPGTRSEGGYAEVFKDRVFVRICLVMVLLITVGASRAVIGLSGLRRRPRPRVDSGPRSRFRCEHLRDRGRSVVGLEGYEGTPPHARRHGDLRHVGALLAPDVAQWTPRRRNPIRRGLRGCARRVWGGGDVDGSEHPGPR